MADIYDFDFKLGSGEKQSMADFKGKAILVVNTASKCGLTPQFKGLEELYKEYHSKGLVVLGFPCNQFSEQDPSSNDEIMQFCQLNYGVTFPMAEKIDVNGSATHPLYKFLKSESKGLLGSEKIKWNFTKFLVDSNGMVVDRFSPTTTPSKLTHSIEALLP